MDTAGILGESDSQSGNRNLHNHLHNVQWLNQYRLKDLHLDIDGSGLGKAYDYKPDSNAGKRGRTK